MSTPLEQFLVKSEMPKKNDQNTAAAVVEDATNNFDEELDEWCKQMNDIQTEMDSTKNFSEIQKIEKEKGILFAEPLYVELADVHARSNNTFHIKSEYITLLDSMKAQEYLAQLYATGNNKEIPKHTAKAFKWYNQLFNNKNEPSIKEILIKYFKTAEGAILVAFRDQNFKAIKEYVEILDAETLIDYRFRTKTLYCLAKIFEKGYDGVRQDNDKAYKFCKQAVNKSYPDAFFTLGYYYELGIGTAKNIEKALQYYKKSAETHQDKDAIFRLKLNKEIKSGTKHFTEKLFEFNNQLIAKDKENIEAQLVVAICNFKGWGTKQNIANGFQKIQHLAKTNKVAKIYLEQFKSAFETERLKILEQEKFLEEKRLKVREQKALEEKRLAEQELEKKRIEKEGKVAKAKRKEEKRLEAEKEATEKKAAEDIRGKKREAAQLAAAAEKKRFEEEKKAAKAKRKAERKIEADKEATEKAIKEATAKEKADKEAAAKAEKEAAIKSEKEARKLKKEAEQQQALEKQQKLLVNLTAKDKKLTSELEATRLAGELAQKKFEIEAKEKLLQQQSLETQQFALKQVEEQNKKLAIELEAKRLADELAQKQQEVAAKENLLQQQLLEKKKNVKQKKKEKKMKKIITHKKKELAFFEERLQKSVVELETKELLDQIRCKKAALEKNEALLMQQQTLLTSINEHSRHLTEKLQSTQLQNEIERQALMARTLSKQLEEETRLGQNWKATLELENLRRQAPILPLQFHHLHNFQSTPPAPQFTPMLNQQLTYPQQPQQPVRQTISATPLPPLHTFPPGAIVSPLPYVVVNVQNFTSSNNFTTQLKQNAPMSVANQPVNQFAHNQQIISSSNTGETTKRNNPYYL